MEKEYLGDGVYVERDEFGNLIVTTEDGIRATNRIVMEPEVLQSFLRWIGPTELDRLVARR